MTNFFITGMDHKNCGLEAMEKADVTASRLPGFYKSLGLKEAVWLQTCNRREIIYTGENYKAQFSPEEFGKIFGINREDSDKYCVFYEGLGAVTHIFRTAAGLNSAIPGETQVLGQVRDAYLKSKELGASGKKLEKLFSAAIHAARVARFESGISKGAVSVAQAAVEIAGRRMDLKGKKVLMIGAGKTNSTAALYLKKTGAVIKFIASRSLEKAKKLAGICGATAVDLNALHDAIAEADLVISATSAPHFVLRMDNAFEAVNNRKTRLLIMDLAVPRDVDPALAGEKVEIINMDDVNNMTKLNIGKRHEAAVIAGAIIEKLARRWVDETETRDQKKSPGPDTGAGINTAFETQTQRA